MGVLLDQQGLGTILPNADDDKPAHHETLPIDVPSSHL
jgi:hypothetical protein